MRVGVRARHRHDDGDTHVPAPRSSKMRLHGESEVSQINSSPTESILNRDSIGCRSCTCYGAPEGDPGVLFEGTPHCEAVHGALHACLRALFGVSVAGILACIFSCMLVYQLLSHEKKKMYWEQLELRCRSLYGQGGGVGPAAGSCGCCNDCGGASPWWTQTPGNLYTPNPDLAPSRFVPSRFSNELCEGRKKKKNDLARSLSDRMFARRLDERFE